MRVPGKGDRIKVTGLDDNTEYRILLRAEKGEEQSQDTETTATTGETRGVEGAGEKESQEECNEYGCNQKVCGC